MLDTRRSSYQWSPPRRRTAGRPAPAPAPWKPTPWVGPIPVSWHGVVVVVVLVGLSVVVFLLLPFLRKSVKATDGTSSE